MKTKPFRVEKEDQQKRVFDLLAEGKTRVQIGKELGLTRASVTRYCAKHKEVTEKAICENKKLRDKAIDLELDFCRSYAQLGDTILRVADKCEAKGDMGNLSAFLNLQLKFLRQVEEFKAGIIGSPKLDITIKEQFQRWVSP